MSIIQVTADDRESRSRVIEVLKGYEDVTVTVRRLPLGDYMIDERLLFERKTLPDFVASIIDGRVFEQAIRLAASPVCKALILEGSARDLAESGMRREALQGALITLTLFLGIPLLRAMDAEESARLMLYAGRQFARIKGHATPRIIRGKRPKDKRKTQLRILQCFPGIGAGTARNLLEKFGSVEAVLAADEQTLMTVAGVGAGRADGIRWALGDRLAIYGDLGPTALDSGYQPAVFLREL